MDWAPTLTDIRHTVCVAAQTTPLRIRVCSEGEALSQGLGVGQLAVDDEEATFSSWRSSRGIDFSVFFPVIVIKHPQRRET